MTATIKSAQGGNGHSFPLIPNRLVGGFSTPPNLQGSGHGFSVLPVPQNLEGCSGSGSANHFISVRTDPNLRIGNLEKEVRTLKAKIQELEPKVIVVREISAAQAKQEILDHLINLEGKQAYPSDIADTLRIDAETVRDICAALTEEGLIE